MKKIHRLKTWPTPFADVDHGGKSFEIRKNDRDYASGDFLVLDAWNPETLRYTGDKPLVRIVTYLMHGGRFGVADDHVVMAIDRLADRQVESLILEMAPPRPASPQSSTDKEPTR